MSYNNFQTQYSNSKINFDLDNEDEFEEFEQDNWATQNGDGESEFFNESWDEISNVDEDLANYLNSKQSS